MSVVLYRDSKGEIHEIPEGVPFKKGADWEEVDVKLTHEEIQLNDSIDKIAQSVGLSVDVVITKLAECLGIEKCSWCQVRSRILQRMGELGWVETLRRLKNSFKDQARSNAK